MRIAVRHVRAWQLPGAEAFQNAVGAQRRLPCPLHPRLRAKSQDLPNLPDSRSACGHASVNTSVDIFGISRYKSRILGFLFQFILTLSILYGPAAGAQTGQPGFKESVIFSGLAWMTG